MVGKTALIAGSKSKLSAKAPPIRDNNSNDKPTVTPKNIFLPNVTSLVEPKMKALLIKSLSQVLLD